jgi:hypothetical protein
LQYIKDCIARKEGASAKPEFSDQEMPTES